MGQGILKEKQTNVRKMKELRITDEVIQQITSLSADKVKTLSLKKHHFIEFPQKNCSCSEKHISHPNNHSSLDSKFYPQWK